MWVLGIKPGPGKVLLTIEPTTFTSIPLVYTFIFMWLSHCLDYCSFVVKFWNMAIWVLQPCTSFQVFFECLVFYPLPYRYSLSISVQKQCRRQVSLILIWVFHYVTVSSIVIHGHAMLPSYLSLLNLLSPVFCSFYCATLTFVLFIPNYIILSNVFINGIIFLNFIFKFLIPGA